MLAKVAAIGAAVIGGIVLADILIHPTGTMAAGQAANEITVPAYAALLGAVPGYGPVPKAA